MSQGDARNRRANVPARRFPATPEMRSDAPCRPAQAARSGCRTRTSVRCNPEFRRRTRRRRTGRWSASRAPSGTAFDNRIAARGSNGGGTSHGRFAYRRRGSSFRRKARAGAWGREADRTVAAPPRSRPCAPIHPASRPPTRRPGSAARRDGRDARRTLQAGPLGALHEMNAGIDEADPFRPDFGGKVDDRGARQVRVHGDVVPLGEEGAKLVEIRIDARLAAGQMQEPGQAGRIEGLAPAVGRGEAPQGFAKGGAGIKAVGAPKIAGVQQLPVRFDVVAHLPPGQHGHGCYTSRKPNSISFSRILHSRRSRVAAGTPSVHLLP